MGWNHQPDSSSSKIQFVPSLPRSFHNILSRQVLSLYHRLEQQQEEFNSLLDQQSLGDGSVNDRVPKNGWRCGCNMI
jgi:hypothetical protein